MGEQKELQLAIEGMHCDGCVNRVTTALGKVAGVKVRKVLLANGDCSSIDWKFLGLSMPMWTFVWFVALGLGALYAGFKYREKHRFHR